MLFIINFSFPSVETATSVAVDHHHYLQRLADLGALIITGEAGLEEICVVEAASPRAADRLAAHHPAVVSGDAAAIVRPWTPRGTLCADPARLLAGGDELRAAAHPITSPADDASDYEVVEASGSIPVQCLAPDRIGSSDPTRLDYLRAAQLRGLRKLVLRHRGDAVGQIEFAPAAASGLPIEGRDLSVINCLWVIETFTGLDSGCRLLAACIERAQPAAALATIAYNSDLGWLPRGFFERQGFTAIEHHPTGRFFGKQPIVAHLMWLPLRHGAERPTWDVSALEGGIHFCPAYPWMSGKRLYWGQDFEYRAIVVREGLRRKEILSQFPVIGTQRTVTWNLVKLGIPASDLEGALTRIQRALIEEPVYYAYVYPVAKDDDLIILFPTRDYRVERDGPGFDEAIRYGLEQGIPRAELVFTPFRFEDEVPSH